MKFFISHSSKDAEIARRFSYFLKNMSHDVEVFCTSIQGTIKQGDYFVKSIEKELKSSSVFIPLISKNYNQRKYCLIELGYAYSKFAIHKRNYQLLPFCIPPITRSEALLGTPISHINSSLINDKEDIFNFIKLLIESRILPESSILDYDFYNFIDMVNSIIMNTNNILGNAIIQPICSSLDNPNAIHYNVEKDKHIVNFKLFANGKKERPNFVSLVYKFPGTINIYEFLQTNINIKFFFNIDNYTESLTHLDIEFKYHEPPEILKSYKIALLPGENKIEISIKGTPKG